MYLASRTDLEAVAFLIRKLEAGGRQGVALSSLAAGAKVTPARLEKLLQKNPEYFVRVGPQSKYTLNRFGAFSKPKEQVLSDIQRSCEQRRWQMLASLVGVCVVVVTTGIIALLQLK